jgi:vacuolar protein-sorting-associated protein 4
MDGVGKDQSGVLVLAATNRPWALDDGVRRRFEKRIHIALPDKHARAEMFKLHAGTVLRDTDCMALAEKTNLYSGADIAIISRDAFMEPARIVQSSTHFKRTSGGGLTPCSPGDKGAIEQTWHTILSEELCPPTVTFKHFCQSVARVKPSVNLKDLEAQDQWTTDFGIDGA